MHLSLSLLPFSLPPIYYSLVSEGITELFFCSFTESPIRIIELPSRSLSFSLPPSLMHTHSNSYTYLSSPFRSRDADGDASTLRTHSVHALLDLPPHPPRAGPPPPHPCPSLRPLFFFICCCCCLRPLPPCTRPHNKRGRGGGRSRVRYSPHLALSFKRDYR